MLEKHFSRELSDASYAYNHEILGLQNVGKSSRRYQIKMSTLRGLF